jgi:TonB family protein
MLSEALAPRLKRCPMLRSPSAVVNAIATAWFATALFAAISYGQSVSGIVYDPTGGIVSGARVMLMEDYVKMREMKSSPSGEFSFADLKPGMYQLQIKQPRLSLFQSTVVLEGAEPVRIYAVLSPARVMEQVEIGATLPEGIPKAALPEPEIRIGGKVEPPEPLVPARPAYPPGAVSRGIEGPVVLFATIKTDGSVGDVTVMGFPHSELQEEAVSALKKCRYRPAELDGQPMENQMTIVFNFRLR